MKRLARILGIIVAVFAVIILALQLTLNSAWMRKKVDSIHLERDIIQS